MSEPAPLTLLAEAVGGRRGFVVLDGFHAVKHALRFGADVGMIATDDPSGLAALAESLGGDLSARLTDLAVVVDRGPLTAAAGGRRHHTGIVGVAVTPTPRNHPAYRLDPRKRADRKAPALLVEDPRHEGNLGAVIRVAAAGNASGVLVAPGPASRPDPFSRGVIRGAAGLHWALPVIGLDSVEEVEGPLVALDPTGDPMDRSQPSSVPRDAVLCLGTERHGLSPDLLERADLRLAIPMRSGVSSLNLATAAAVALYCSVGQMPATRP